MRRRVVPSGFLKRLALFLRLHPDLEQKINTTMQKVVVGDYAGLHMHALHGPMKGAYAVRISQRYRLIFALEPDAVVFVDIGSHDAVY